MIKRVEYLITVILIVVTVVFSLVTTLNRDHLDASYDSEISFDLVVTDDILTTQEVVTDATETVTTNDSTEVTTDIDTIITDELIPDAEEFLPAYVITEEERELLAKIVYLESGICSFDCQIAVASVIFNRLDSGRWKQDMNRDGIITVYDIVYYPGAFSTIHKVATCQPSASAYNAVDYVTDYGVSLPTEVRYFRTNHDFKWENYANYCILDKMYFGYFTNWEQGAY